MKKIILYTMTFLMMSISFSLQAKPSWALQRGVGQVDMPVTTSDQIAKKYFLTGLALMESFEFETAKRYFVKAQKQDPKFALAYWGEAMTSVIFLWFSVDYLAVENAYQRMREKADLHHLNRLEKALIDSTEVLLKAPGRQLAATSKHSAIYQYRLAMEKVYQSFKTNPDVIYFYAHAILATRYGINDYATNLKAGELLQSIYHANQSHPGINHLILHSFENVPQSYMAKTAAEHYAQIAPGAIHGLHMPSHYYFYQGNWKRLIELNQTAWVESLKRQKIMHLSDDSLEYHGYSWLIYAYLQLNDSCSAIEAIHDISLKQISVKRNNYLAYVIGQLLLHTQRNAKQQQFVQLIKIDTQHLSPEIKAGFWFSKAVRRGYKNLAGLNKAIDIIEKTILPKLDNVAPTVKGEAIIIYQQLKALKAYAEGKVNEAIVLLRQIAKKEDYSYREHGVPMVVKPTHELLGEILMDQHRYGEALIEYKRELLHNPLRRLSVEGLLLAAKKTNNSLERQYAFLMLKKL